MPFAVYFIKQWCLEPSPQKLGSFRDFFALKVTLQFGDDDSTSTPVWTNHYTGGISRITFHYVKGQNPLHEFPHLWGSYGET